jgi:UPF0755 protein
MSKKKKTKSRIGLWLFTVIIFVALFFLYQFLGSNTGDLHSGDYLYIKTGSNYEAVKKNLTQNGFIKNEWSFNLLAQQIDYPSKIKAGKYHIAKGMSNLEMLRMLRSGKQTPVKLVLTKLRTRQDFLNIIAAKLETDTLQLKQLFKDATFLAAYHLDSNTSFCAIMPDTYEFWWNVTAERLFKKIAASYLLFWTEERIEKAKNLHLYPSQVIILASIIEEETNYNPEKDTIASVYLNRLKKGMMLQADPTARFAFGDFSIKRITALQTNFPSPYNTYTVKGLPPGPICTPSKKTIEAVLNAAPTDYLYFCAKATMNGSHSFAKDYATHQQNARKFQQALNERGIK